MIIAGITFTPTPQMLDALYLLGTIAFFALMLGYVSFCERLGQSADASGPSAEART